MTKAFEKVRFTYKELPGLKPRNPYGIYINVPFCRSTCNFCSYYKEVFREEDIKRYIPLLLKDIMDGQISGSPKWIYFGGGTPNLLSIQQIKRIIDALKNKVELNNMGIEIHPAQVDLNYIRDLGRLRFSKISIGVESLTSEVNRKAGRQNVSSGDVFQLIHFAKENNIFINVDMMVGLAGQNERIFLEDVRLLSKSEASQITLYPFLVLNGMKKEASMADDHQFMLIEEAASYLKRQGYTRRGPWNFTLDSDLLYDTSRDELLGDYIGFGAGGFSSCGKWKTVNPTYQKYARNIMQGKKMGLVAERSKSSDDWGNFARMISELKLQTSPKFPPLVNMVIRLMQMNGYGKDGELNAKGIYFAHHLLKTVIESRPYPLHNPTKITNYQLYMSEVQ